MTLYPKKDIISPTFDDSIFLFLNCLNASLGSTCTFSIHSLFGLSCKIYHIWKKLYESYFNWTISRKIILNGRPRGREMILQSKFTFKLAKYKFFCLVQKAFFNNYFVNICLNSSPIYKQNWFKLILRVLFTTKYLGFHSQVSIERQQKALSIPLVIDQWLKARTPNGDS